ncbi:MAG: hypothetical protein ACLR8Y_08710 [Alistipes indistinctus]
MPEQVLRRKFLRQNLSLLTQNLPFYEKLDRRIRQYRRCFCWASGCSSDRNEPRGNGTLNIRLEMDDRIDLVATQACNTKAAPDLGAFTLEVTQ